MTNEEIVGPWTHGFEEEDPKKGGCPKVQVAVEGSREPTRLGNSLRRGIGVGVKGVAGT